ncbi:NAD(P)/FAD-dependent oxidoreductase [Vreelandella sp. EE7]
MPENPLAGSRPESVAVIGAGIAGLACAQALAEQGIGATLFDKARGPGGRMASKRRPTATLDLGAQSFTVRDPRFSRLIDTLVENGAVAPWPAAHYRVDESGWQALVDDQPRYIGAPRMSAMTRELHHRLAAFAHVHTHFQTRITALEKGPGTTAGWQLRDHDDNLLGPFDTVVITAPPPQAAALIGEWDAALTSACQARPQRGCWAGYVVFETTLPALEGIDDWDSLHARHPVLRLASRYHTRPGRESQPESLSLLAQLDWSDDNLELSPRQAACALYAAFRSLLPREMTLPPIRELCAHRWRYAQAAAPSNVSYLYSRQGLALCGESFRGSRVEDAWLSGFELANALLALPNSYPNQTTV